MVARLQAKSLAADLRAEEKFPAADPDRWCWPNGPAWNETEAALFSKRLLAFAGKGLHLADAEALADKLVNRDRDQDDRRLCLECSNCQQGRCTRWQAAGIGQAQIPAGMRTTLQRCVAFRTWEGL